MYSEIRKDRQFPSHCPVPVGGFSRVQPSVGLQPLTGLTWIHSLNVSLLSSLHADSLLHFQASPWQSFISVFPTESISVLSVCVKYRLSHRNESDRTGPAGSCKHVDKPPALGAPCSHPSSPFASEVIPEFLHVFTS